MIKTFCLTRAIIKYNRKGFEAMLKVYIALTNERIVKELTQKIKKQFRNCEVHVNTSLQDECNGIKYDIYFLDIEMSNQVGYGLVFAMDVKLKQKNPVIVFISKYEAFWQSAYRVNAYWFIVEKNFYSEISEVLLSLREHFSHNYIYFRSGGKIHKASICELICLYKDDNKVCLVTEDDVYVTWSTMKKIQNFINRETNFLKINAGVIINITFLARYSIHSDEVFLRNGMQFPVSRSNKKHLLEILKDEIGF